MANAPLISRMLKAVDDYEGGQLSSEQVERIVESHMQGLEQIGLREVHESRNLCHRLVVAHFFIGEEEFISVEQVSIIISELRRFFQSLADRQENGVPKN